MALVTLLVALALERIMGSFEELRGYEHFRGDAELFLRDERDEHPALRAARLLTLFWPVLLVGLVWYGLHLAWHPFVYLFYVIVLLHTFGRRDLEAEVEAYLDAWHRGDEESAGWYAAELLGEMPPENGQLLTRALMEKVLVEAHERVLGIVFWFLVAGPVGAVLFRLSSLLNEKAEHLDGPRCDWVRRLHHAVSWPSVRLCAVGFALSGSFVEAAHAWREQAQRWLDHNRGVLVASGFGALRYDFTTPPGSGPVDWNEQNHLLHETISLVRRTLLVWLALLAMLTLSGWAS